MWILRGLLGIAALTAFSWLVSENRRRVEWRIVWWLMLKVPLSPR